MSAERLVWINQYVPVCYDSMMIGGCVNVGGELIEICDMWMVSYGGVRDSCRGKILKYAPNDMNMYHTKSQTPFQ